MISTNLIITICCDRCGYEVETEENCYEMRRPDVTLLEGRAVTDAVNDGWSVSDQEEVCPNCKEAV